jgi:2-amino-4-hydroxy-6-hydroxymethyldihydropteridine diphosphokinase
MFKESVLSLGSNIGNRMQFLTQAKKAIQKKAGVILKESNIYETEPWGVKNQDFYLNQIISLQTKLSPESLLSILQEIEKDLGRERLVPFGPRTIDIDILYYCNQILESKNLKIPHPFIQKRRFILVPLSEILPQMVHPLLNKTNIRLLEELEDDNEIIKWQPLEKYEK